ncbi:type II toxin-antitoxin system RelE/ParE family toxin [Sorangium sp. So ce1000]|uniref:type II toxin-antitoxin system RelE/ParE family toxin n=1 Tax=Sorangium sp. So ce1000 TaxID=3133325 RepID=UPI003F61CACC
MKVRFLGRSAEQARAVDAWWRENRPAAPSLFADELASTLRMLRRTPEMGAPYSPKAKDGVRRVLLSRTQYYLYYAVEPETRLIGVLAIWSCLRGKPPSLGRVKDVKKKR